MTRRRRLPFQSSKYFSCSWLSSSYSSSSGFSRSTDSWFKWSCIASEIWLLSWLLISHWFSSSQFVSPFWAQRLMQKSWMREKKGTSKVSSNSWSCRCSVPPLESSQCLDTWESWLSQTLSSKQSTFTSFGAHGSSNLSSCSSWWWTSWLPSFLKPTRRFRLRERSSTTGTSPSWTRRPSSWCQQSSNSPNSGL